MRKIHNLIIIIFIAIFISGIVYYQEVFSLEQMPSDELIEQLKDKSNSKRSDIISTLAFKGNENTIPALIEIIQDKDEKEDIILNTILALGLLRAKEAVPDLINLLDSDDPEIRGQAILILGSFRDKKALPALEKINETEKDDKVKEKLLTTINKIKMGEKEIKINSDVKKKVDEIIQRLSASMIDPSQADLQLYNEVQKLSSEKGAEITPYLIKKTDEICEVIEDYEGAGWMVIPIMSIIDTVGKPALPALRSALQDKTLDKKTHLFIMEAVEHFTSGEKQSER
ncbi:MAG: HEAT repeat domain-containing protein [Candidatus Omnitrophica bacterium]|nr:HEAT repeat domain-containing protein [Candidatus Omnitrophota bacterium]MBU1048052.1 HEAT repeat domain-containing protein [Candidatus Omnitrophota bacterium]MBU1631319.1 HEAT repeat domain-containing protein [Candidatus Omnitrophota bacterium]MBU1766528.1 HEAT repeat domain-containing protein [Candidatus Omnitrophota bacterium]MBU1889422.1 HEAT repeat domain-containing protein [Candidatus Omnitrophota bacterium]